MKNEGEHKFLQREFFLFNFFRYERLGTKRENGIGNVHFFFLFEASSLVASIFKYSSTSCTGVSSFFLVALGVLF